MIKIKHTFEINGISAQQVYDWWLGLDTEKYKKWHPYHRKFVWNLSDKNRLNVGNGVIFREIINGFNFYFIGKISAIKEGQFLKFKHSFLPLYFSFSYETAGTKTKVSFESFVGYEGKAGALLDFIFNILYPIRMREAVIKHAIEEHNLIKNLLSDKH